MANVFKGKALTDQLRVMAQQVHTIGPDGTQVTRYEAWADLIWKYALGWTEQIRDDDGTLKEVEHKPVAWALQFLAERLEGKAAPAQADAGGGMKAVDKVRDLAKQRLNNL